MGGIAQNTRYWTRRRALALALVPLVPGLSGARAQDASILVVSRKRLLNDTVHARTLLQAEIALTAELQSQVDRIKEALSAEEQELTRLRPTLARELFDQRVAEFDNRVRRERRETQQRAAALQNAFRQERLKLVRALDPLLQEVLQGRGASIIIDGDQTLARDPALDVTDLVIARFNETVPPPAIPDIESLGPGPEEGVIPE